MDTKALKRWEKMNISLLNYQSVLRRKPSKFELGLVDLLFVSNFKGGNSSIHEHESVLNVKLKSYQDALKEIHALFSDKHLYELNDLEVDTLIELGLSLLKLCKNPETSIDGFKESYASALLHAYFPNLLPILDRRVLGGLKLINKSDLRSGQVKDILRFYPSLIKQMHRETSLQNRPLRDIDRQYFSVVFDYD
ncbi:MAG: hypothetical protein ABI675_24265 [Chitinophagaceae bacterium]